MLHTMDPSIIRSLLNGQPDILSEATAKEEEFFKKLSCPVCCGRGGCEKRLKPPKMVVDDKSGEAQLVESPFSSGDPLPQGHAHCIHCGTDFDPYSGVISRTEASSLQPADLDPAAMLVSARSDLPQE